MSVRKFTTEQMYSVLARVAEVCPHMIPIASAVRTSGCHFVWIGQGAGSINTDEWPDKIISIIADDPDYGGEARSVGPIGFHEQSLIALFRKCRSIAVISSAAEPSLYASAALAASVQGDNVCIIETTPQHDLVWLHAVQAWNPAAFVTFCAPQANKMESN